MPLGKGKAIVPFFLALIYGLLIVSVPWEELRGVPYPDIENYEVRYAAVKNYGLSYFRIDSGVLNYLSAEYLWYFLLASSSLSGIDFDLFVMTCSFSAAFISAFWLFGRLHVFWALVLLINPISIDLFSSQLRSALAFGLVLFAISFHRKGLLREGWAYSFFLAACFVHTSMLLIIFVYGISILLERKKLRSTEARLLLSIGIGVFLAAAYALLANSILGAIGDRRSLDANEARSFTYIGFWLFLGMAFCLRSTVLALTNWRFYYSVLVLIFVGVTELLAVPSFRILAISLPVIFSVFPLLKVQDARFVIFSVLSYEIILFYYWVN